MSWNFFGLFSQSQQCCCTFFNFVFGSPFKDILLTPPFHCILIYLIIKLCSVCMSVCITKKSQRNLYMAPGWHQVRRSEVRAKWATRMRGDLSPRNSCKSYIIWFHYVNFVVHTCCIRFNDNYHAVIPYPVKHFICCIHLFLSSTYFWKMFIILCSYQIIFKIGPSKNWRNKDTLCLAQLYHCYLAWAWHSSASVFFLVSVSMYVSLVRMPIER